MTTRASRRIRSRGLLCLTLLVSAIPFGCAGRVPPAPVPSGVVPLLGPDEGLVILQVDTDVALSEIALDRFVAARNLPKGEHLWVVRLPAGSYAWKSVLIGSESGNRDRYPVRNLYLDERTLDPRDEFVFDVVAGHVNYPGAAIIRTSDYGRSAALPISFRVRNHAAMAIRRLRDTQPEILEALPVRYAGSRGDTFLEHYEAVRRRKNEDAVESQRASGSGGR